MHAPFIDLKPHKPHKPHQPQMRMVCRNYTAITLQYTAITLQYTAITPQYTAMSPVCNRIVAGVPPHCRRCTTACTALSPACHRMHRNCGYPTALSGFSSPAIDLGANRMTSNETAISRLPNNQVFSNLTRLGSLHIDSESVYRSFIIPYQIIPNVL